MANRFFSPNQQFADTAGLPYAGGSLTFYASGTTTPLNTYSDRALTSANTNPVVLDSAGRAGNIFLQNLAYKVVLADANSVTIWTADPVFASDFSTTAQFSSGSGSPNGSVAGSAGSATIPASAYWDATNNILYVCTQTGTTSTAVWTAINASSTTAVVPVPQGRLTLTTSTPVMTATVSGATTVYYTPYNGNLIPIYNGTAFIPTIFAELSLAIVSSHLANTNYDVFVFLNSGVVTVGTGPAWTSSTARGTGAGTTQLSRVTGLLVNTVSMTARNGSSTYSVAANQGIFVGTIRINASQQVDFILGSFASGGVAGVVGLSNMYNRVDVAWSSIDSGSSYNYTNATIRQARGGTGMQTSFIRCVDEDAAYFSSTNTIIGLAASAYGAIGIGLDSTTAFVSGATGSIGQGNGQNVTANAFYNALPGLGWHILSANEKGDGGSGATWNGQSSPLIGYAHYRGKY